MPCTCGPGCACTDGDCGCATGKCGCASAKCSAKASARCPCGPTCKCDNGSCGCATGKCACDSSCPKSPSMLPSSGVLAMAAAALAAGVVIGMTLAKMK
mmetsp:Transcript_61316/g.147674  ORF Transcript_61316/g.147674 Transcript_61316/m.147674 type:complete len:99 (-) Transcript_61316:67-363(-)